MQNMSLIDLLERVRQSEDDWQSERLGVTFWRKRLWDTFWQSVASVVMDYLWKQYHLSDDDLSDIAYESIQNLLKKLENPKLRFNSENQLLYYIRRTATNCAIDFFRKRKRKEDIFIKREEEEDIFIKLRSKIADRSRAEDTILDAIEDEEFWQWVSQLDPIDQIIAEGISREDKVTKIQERINKELKLDLSYYQVYRLYNQVKDKLEQYFEQRGRRPTPARPKSPTVPTPELVEVPPDEAIAWCIVVRCMPWLSGIADHLLALLQHKNKRVITTALGTLRVPAVVEQLSEAQRQQLAQQCLQLLHHPDSGVIASSLVTLRVPAVVEQLSEAQRQQLAQQCLQLLHHPDSGVIASSLVTLEVPAVVEQLSEAQRQQLAQQCLQLLHHPDSGVIASSLVTLEVPAVVEQLSEAQRQQLAQQCLQLLHHPDSGVIASSLVTLEVPAVVEQLSEAQRQQLAQQCLQLLHHPDSGVIASSLVTLRVPAVVEQLSEAQRQQLAQQCLQLLHHPDSGVIASSLVTLEVPAVVEQLSESQRQQIVSQCHLLLDNWDERVRASVIGTLSCFMRNQHDRLMRLVQSMRFDPSPKVQRSVCWALEQMGLATDGAG
jgi:hypothetical protein